MGYNPVGNLLLVLTNKYKQTKKIAEKKREKNAILLVFQY